MSRLWLMSSTHSSCFPLSFIPASANKSFAQFQFARSLPASLSVARFFCSHQHRSTILVAALLDQEESRGWLERERKEHGSIGLISIFSPLSSKLLYSYHDPHISALLITDIHHHAEPNADDTNYSPKYSIPRPILSSRWWFTQNSFY